MCGERSKRPFQRDLITMLSVRFMIGKRKFIRIIKLCYNRPSYFRSMIRNWRCSWICSKKIVNGELILAGTFRETCSIDVTPSQNVPRETKHGQVVQDDETVKIILRKETTHTYLYTYVCVCCKFRRNVIEICAWYRRKFHTRPVLDSLSNLSTQVGVNRDTST